MLLTLVLGASSSAQAAEDLLEPAYDEAAAPELGQRLLHGVGFGVVGALATGAGAGVLGCGIGAVVQHDSTGYFSGPLWGCIFGGLLAGAPGLLVGMPLGISLVGSRGPYAHPASAYWGTFLGAGAGIGVGSLVLLLTKIDSTVVMIPTLAFAGAVLGWALPPRAAGAPGRPLVTPSLAIAPDGTFGSIGFAGRF